ncbi:hypothetical protein J2Y38_004779 [Flavobacterium sp. 2755]|uniref:hypothetical protein n=1 Tax=Flavobacterium sp. 2755 TaxID=2817765 RepID=UPI002862E52C|nr:hypothetical protein [Flavobacterium sp. 2755]MDR6764546.1 hypothetical protein [Flavobacterium sp. 2755]
MKSVIHFYIFIFLVFSINTYSQEKKLTARQIITKAADAYNEAAYITYNSNYNLYLDYNSKKVYEHYSGMVLKKNNVNYFKIKNTEFITFKNIGIKINNDEKAIVIEKQKKKIDESPLSLKNYLDAYNAKLIETDNKNYICELTPNKITQIMLSKIVIYIRKKDYSIAKQSLFFVEQMESKDSKGKRMYSLPRLEITFTPRPRDEKSDSYLVSKENYFSEKGSDITISKRFSTYQLFKS